jgi:hypothetical protein
MLQTINTILIQITVFLLSAAYMNCIAVANELVREPRLELVACGNILREAFAIRHRVTIPVDGEITISCESGGPGDCSFNGNWTFSRDVFVAAGRLGPSGLYFIEGHEPHVRKTAGAEFSSSHNKDAVFVTAAVSKGWFGGGQDVSFRVTAILREYLSDNTALIIGRMCSAKVLSPGEPQ